MEAHSKVGTPLYMSPEVLRGDGYAFSSDVWSTGCLLYELAMLRSPFKSEGLSLYVLVDAAITFIFIALQIWRLTRSPSFFFAFARPTKRYALFQKISRADYPALPEWFSAELRDLAARLLSLDATERPAMGEVASLAAASHSASRALQESRGAEAKEEVHEWRPDLLFAAPPAAGNDDGGHGGEGKAGDDAKDDARDNADGAADATNVAANGGDGQDDDETPQPAFGPNRDERVATEKGRHDDDKSDADGNSTTVTKSFGGVPGAPRPQGRKQLREQKSSDEDVPQATEMDHDLENGFGAALNGSGNARSHRPSSRAAPLGSRSRALGFDDGNDDNNKVDEATVAQSPFGTNLFAGEARHGERPGSRAAESAQHRSGNRNNGGSVYNDGSSSGAREDPAKVRNDRNLDNADDLRRRANSNGVTTSGGGGMNEKGLSAGGRDGATPTNALLNGELCLAMEICWDKLQVAGYHDARAQRSSSSSKGGINGRDGAALAPLLRTHFAFPAPATRAGSNMTQGPTSAHALFTDMIHACRWCLQRLGSGSSLGSYQSDADLELASPLDVSRALLVSLGHAGLPPHLAAEWELTPGSVAKGWGTPVVALLDFLAGEVLRRAPPPGLWGAPSYHWSKYGSNEGSNGEREGEEDGGDDEDASLPEDEMEAELSDEEPDGGGLTSWYSRHGGGHGTEGGGGSSSSSSSSTPSTRHRTNDQALGLLRSNVTADAWREDALRVEPSLQRRATEAKVAQAGWGGSSSSDWRSRLEALQRHARALGLDLPHSKAGTGGPNGANNGRSEASSSQVVSRSSSRGGYRGSSNHGADSIEAVRVAGAHLHVLVDRLADGERMLCPIDTSSNSNNSNNSSGSNSHHDGEEITTAIAAEPGLSSITAAHRALRLEYNHLSAQRVATSEARDVLSATAAEVAVACAEAETACAEAADASTDLTPLRQLQSALPALVAQCRSMDLRMGILSQHHMRAARQTEIRPGSSRHDSSEIDDDNRSVDNDRSSRSRIGGY